ncbi:hypothetical protein SAMN02745148_01346 [Modicisalibacter ilicicola DSM 19980]|uniref:Uncharacterized protein n=1 Tax=Modicisalibacter ilicicola DSM 19980 TaxID=1121942 RepID=A0A1M4X7T4_9GAMM|nr:hypothetical protein [Halomonas ilicicola]SHE89192.1 hypothetical protein SAMN02745148_01346 [Halomonas ilicicola DSM 19980]
MAVTPRRKAEDEGKADKPGSADLARGPRRLAAVLAFGVLAGLAFFYLHRGLIEGGAFVSLLTLAFGVGLVTLIWNRITHITILGSEIKLQRLTQQAESLLGELDVGKADLYRTSLRLVQHAATAQEEDTETLGARGADLVELLETIDRARLLEVLDGDALSATDRLIGDMSRALLPAAESSSTTEKEVSPPDIEALQARLARHDNHRVGIQGADVGKDDAPDRAAAALRALLRYRRRLLEIAEAKGTAET